MPGPETQKDDDRLAAETERIKAAYGRRQCGDLYSWFNPGHLFIMQARERRVLALLQGLGLSRLADGISWRWGATPAIGWGNLSSGGPGRRTSRASSFSLKTWLRPGGPGPRGRPGAGQCRLSAFLPSTFDLVLQSLLFTSILDPAMKQVVAQEMLRVLKPGGFILWYDYHVNNPWNPDVGGVKKKEIRPLFPHCRIQLRRITLAPPLTRLLAPHSFLLCSLLEKIRVFNTHYLGVIRQTF